MKNWCIIALATSFCVSGYSLGFVSDTNMCPPKTKEKKVCIPKTKKVIFDSPIKTKKECTISHESVPCNSLYDSGYSLKKEQIPSGYNAYGRICTQKPWNIFIQGEFLYWQPVQEDMQLGSFEHLSGFTAKGKIVEMDFDYEYALRVGIGGHFGTHDDWTLLAQYTRFYTEQESGKKTPGSINDTLVFSYPWWDYPSSDNRDINEVHGKWKLNMDIIELRLIRSYYVGTHLIFHPFLGLRGALIDQELYAYFIPKNSSIPNPTKPSSDSWGVGASGGLGMDWFFNSYVRMFGHFAAHLLYTHYDAKHEEFDGYEPPMKLLDYHNEYDVLRPSLECAVGLVGGCYLGKKAAHFDLSVGYEFHCFWHQNMMKYYSTKIVNPTRGAASAMIGNLYLHGPAVGARFDW